MASSQCKPQQETERVNLLEQMKKRRDEHLLKVEDLEELIDRLEKDPEPEEFLLFRCRRATASAGK